MNNDQREITSATVTVTLTLTGLGVFGPGSSYDQAKQAATLRIIQGLHLGVEAIQDVQVRAISFEAVANQCRQRLMSAGNSYPRSSCAACGAFSPKWRECDAAILIEAQQK